MVAAPEGAARREKDADQVACAGGAVMPLMRLVPELKELPCPYG